MSLILYGYFEFIVNNICNRLTFEIDRGNSCRLVKFNDTFFRLIVNVGGINVGSERCVVTFNLDEVVVDIYACGKLNCTSFKCDFVYDSLVEDKVIWYLVDNFGRFFPRYFV